MYSTTLLASLLALAHGFASTPECPPRPKGQVQGTRDGSAGDATGTIKAVRPMACTASDGRPGESFFVYSADFSMLYEIADQTGLGAIPPEVTHGLVGNTWQVNPILACLSLSCLTYASPNLTLACLT